jgi:hypothetical protein
VPHKNFYSPNGREEVLARWRFTNIQQAVGAIVCAGGVIKGDRLGGILGVSPRALRRLLVWSGFFTVEYRATPGDKDQSWYRINQEKVPREPGDLPPLRRIGLDGGGKTPRLNFDNQGKPISEGATNGICKRAG